MSTPMSDEARALHARLVRNHTTAPRQREQREPLYDTSCARLAPGTAARKLGASIDTLAPGKRGCPYHFHHAEEEMFIVLQGEGSLRVAGQMLPLVAGDVVFIPPGPEYPHQIINTSDAPLTYLSISNNEPLEICEYPDSGKLGVFADGRDGAAPVRRLHRADSQLDYWDGEP